MTYTSIEERLAAQRSRAWARSFTGQASTVAGRAPAQAPGERRSEGRVLFIALLAMALASLVITVSAMADQSALRVAIFRLTAEDDQASGGFAVGIRVNPVNDQDTAQIAKLTAKLNDTLKEQVSAFRVLELASHEAGRATSDRMLVFIAMFQGQVALQRIGAVLTPVFEEFARTQGTVSLGNGPAAVHIEE